MTVQTFGDKMKKITHSPNCGYRLNAPIDEPVGFCPLCDKFIVLASFSCPECTAELECMCVIGSDESGTGMTERLYGCDCCGSAWSVITNEVTGRVEIKRYFFG